MLMLDLTRIIELIIVEIMSEKTDIETNNNNQKSCLSHSSFAEWKEAVMFKTLEALVLYITSQDEVMACISDLEGKNVLQDEKKECNDVNEDGCYEIPHRLSCLLLVARAILLNVIEFDPVYKLEYIDMQKYERFIIMKLWENSHIENMETTRKKKEPNNNNKANSKVEIMINLKRFLKNTSLRWMKTGKNLLPEDFSVMHGLI